MNKVNNMLYMALGMVAGASLYCYAEGHPIRFKNVKTRVNNMMKDLK